MRSKITIVAGLFLLVASCTSQNANISKLESDQIVSSAELFVKANSTSGLEFSVTIEAVSGNYARVRVEPKLREEVDSAIVYLKKQKEWSGVEIGTAFDNGDLIKQGFPPQVLK